ncbi:hypothetical protein ANCCEY_13262 [Ancylostoma ceylanicum]|uniref:Uncharacterized protein n=1 Tax=Ancylostoma ceylanicum TaxID=53326 RepID=A0A0D6L977_9BILA|nr:hypothetical protein ANCCEY_13262 [Ancylostoma ceylanicum]
MVVDGNISVDEWCDCFSFADDLRHEPPCHKAKHAVDPHMAVLFQGACEQSLIVLWIRTVQQRVMNFVYGTATMW